jgi:Protein of unknown function (DUF2637)
MWSRLPSNLRTILGCALVLGIVVTAAAFTLSFFALRAAASNPRLEFGRGHEWLFPIALDAALVFAEVLLLGASMVRVRNQQGHLETYNRAIPLLLVFAFGVGTVYFNVTRVPPELRLITAVPPAASILMTIGLAYLLKMLTTVSGGTQAYEAPPPAQAMLGAPGGPIQGAIWRPDTPGYAPVPPWAADGSLGTSPTSTNGHPGGELSGAEASDATKRALIDLYLSRRSPEQLQVETGSSIVAGVAADYGVTVSGREANRQLDAFRSAQQAAKRRR